MNGKEFGFWGEEKAKEYLEGKGFVIKERNYRCKLGEVDLIAQDGDSLVFIEVKTRSSAAFGFPVEAIGRRKQNKYIQMASIYIKEKSLYGISFRFDAVEVMPGSKGQPLINHIANAFQSSGGKYYF